MTGEARTLGVFLGSSARSARFSDRASRAPLLSGPFDLFFRLAFPSGNSIGPFIAQDQRCKLIHRCEHNSSLDSVLCVSVCMYHCMHFQQKDDFGSVCSPGSTFFSEKLISGQFLFTSKNNFETTMVMSGQPMVSRGSVERTSCNVETTNGDV